MVYYHCQCVLFVFVKDSLMAKWCERAAVLASAYSVLYLMPALVFLSRLVSWAGC